MTDLSDYQLYALHIVDLANGQMLDTRRQSELFDLAARWFVVGRTERTSGRRERRAALDERYAAAGYP